MINPARIYLLKVKNRSTRTGCEIFGSSSKIVEKNWLLLGNRNIYCLRFSNTSSKMVFSERDHIFEYSHYSFDLCEYIYGIHHWQILWSSYRKLVWVRFELTTTEFRSDARTDWAIRPWVQLALRANFVQLLQFHRLFSVTFHFGCLPSSVATFILIEVFCR